MQTTLLSIGIAVILALVAALVGPVFIDWGQYRAAIEAEASEMIGAPVRVGGNIKAPQKVKDVKPTYPAIAQSARVQGIVIIEATIGPSGQVEEAKVLRSIPLLDAAALDAVKQWQFTPTLLNGVPVPVIMTVTVNFTLQ